MKEKLDELFVEMWIFIEYEIFEKHEENLIRQKKFMNKISEKYGSKISKCPKEYEEEYELIHINFLNAMEDMKKYLTSKKINRKKVLGLIKETKANKNFRDFELIGMLDHIGGIEKNISAYTYEYHAHKCSEIITSILNSSECLLKFISEKNHKRIAV